MRADRLLKLADFLETVPRRVFRMNYWVQRKATKPEGDAPGECGFAGCAMGWAAHAKLFRGLREHPRYENTILYKAPSGEENTDFGAASALFEIDSIATHNLFNPDYYSDLAGVRRTVLSVPIPTPKQVAKRIRKFVAENKSSQAKAQP